MAKLNALLVDGHIRLSAALLPIFVRAGFNIDVITCLNGFFRSVKRLPTTIIRIAVPKKEDRAQIRMKIKTFPQRIKRLLFSIY